MFTHCEFISKSEGDLRNHINSNHNKPEFQCNSCEFKSKDMSTLTAHNKSHHEHEKYEWTRPI